MSPLGSNSFSSYATYSPRPQYGRRHAEIAVQNRIAFDNDTDESDGDMEIDAESEGEIELEEETEYDLEESVENEEELEAVREERGERRQRDRRDPRKSRPRKQLLDILA